jgi:type II secretion system protein J
MSTDRPAHGQPQAGLTLIETIVAVSIFALIAAVSLSVYRTVSDTLAHQDRWRREWVPAAAALDGMRRDLACACAPVTVADRVFVLDPGRDDGQDSSLLTCYTATPSDDPASPSRLAVDRVSYAVRPGSGAEGGDLYREACRLDDRGSPGSPRAEIVARRVTRFSAAVHDGRQWTTKWVTGQGRGLPRAARLTLVFTEGGRPRTLETSAYMPAGGGRPARAAW